MPKKKSPVRAVLEAEQLQPHLARAIIEERIRLAILDGSLPTGTAVRQQELANLYGVSRMPVREALRQLEAQGLLTVVHHKGAVVAELINDTVSEAYDLRLLLEREALRLSVPLLDETDLATAQQAIDQLEVEQDYSVMAQLNRDFHMALYGKASNRRLLRLIDQGLEEEERFLRFNMLEMGLADLIHQDHRDQLEAARARDTERCVALLEVHLQRAIDAINRYLDDKADAAGA
ncbi:MULTISPECIES: GntR family transcriptional regulator [unclassified Pseudomonas]|uniref:GntR family transcriptional regulator n=1 Tax=unclassified Pseudomonas TaxID=196821 RepID=UPI000BC4BD98|nr:MULTISPECIES: GntR family transcriptional regulator [unclassified Pseudomonas]PVZ15281.1 DNA-binding GntR family transcriptional regulator [Pseudomonas sp. URIL14HWK12:I12]PVZ24655.1 DNA-binding GntR family transcriptional regulator [Pseudomonas sp. URIL14HWK12:I10]PVZ34500.1 DNA-binding GntR family transcriptional regulator [Pseudomonas sp. URIL14HWK12:I11]SNZ18872.1 DNA-binding transcriptional regulator, GntR family [Pseudomonas sp. URIL14HWK12:I9]